MIDRPVLILLAVVLGLLVAGTIAALAVTAAVRTDSGNRFAANLRQRVWSWWLMVVVFAGTLLLGKITTIVLFALTSFLALREFITLTPTRRGDHRALFWAFFVIIPIQYILVAQGRYGLFSVFIPVYVFVLIPARIAAAGETTDFLGRVSRLQWGLLTCVYFLSHVPALMTLDIQGYDGPMAALLLFFVITVQVNDVLQYVCGTTLGKHKIAPLVSPNKTVEGFIGGFILTTGAGALLSLVTPFGPIAGASFGAAIALMGFFGDVTMSAIKRDLGVKDFSATLPGHGGVLDRLDSLSFAAPVFFHLVRFFFAETPDI